MPLDEIVMGGTICSFSWDLCSIFLLNFPNIVLLHLNDLGMVLETNITSILQSIKDQGKMHKDSLSRADASESASTIRERIGAEQSTWQYNW